MVAKKTAGKKKAASRKAQPGTDIAVPRSMSEWEKRLAEAAEAQSATEHVSESTILSIRGGSFKIGGETIGDGKTLSVIILASSHQNAYYDSPFDDEEPSAPACFAVSETGVDMAPVEDCPHPQNDQCKGCWADEFETDNRGRGKACGQGRMLAMIDADADVDEAELVSLRLGVYSSKNWARYVKGLQRKLNRPSFGVVTTLSFDPEQDYPVLLFEVEEVIESAEALESIVGRLDEAKERSLSPPDFSLYVSPEEKKPAGRGSKASGKARGKKTAARRGRA